MRRKLLTGCSNVDVFFLILVAVGTLGGCAVVVTGVAMIMSNYMG